MPQVISDCLAGEGINRLYAHQAAALDAVRNGNNIVVVTPTASGKTLCYNLPVLTELVTNQKARALYLFPTKALTQDQLVSIDDFGLVPAAVYDGDTPDSTKAAIREQDRIILTNPDMLHLGILPNHLKWHDFFTAAVCGHRRNTYLPRCFGTRWPMLSGGCVAWPRNMGLILSLFSPRLLSLTPNNMPNVSLDCR